MGVVAACTERMVIMDGNNRDEVARLFIDETRQVLAQEFRRIAHCLRQLDDAQVWQRPTPHVNCIGNLILHLCGNLRQWYLHGIGGGEDVRNRPAEFAESEAVSRERLQATLDDLFARIDLLLRGVPDSVLVEPRRIQGFETNGLAAMYTTMTHLEGHALQISYITHMLTGDRYEPFWKPANPEQGG